MNLKFTVIKISLPEYCTGCVYDIKVFNDPITAIEYKDKLESNNKNDDACWYDVIVDKQET